jgi:hypothetical protein
VTTIILIAALSILGWSTWTVWTGYMAATGTPGERALAAFRNMATLIYSHAVAVGGALATVLISGADVIGMPEFRAVLQQYLTPEVAALLIALVPVVTIYLRTRTFGFERREGE